jgi:hypothetical protein
MEMLKERWAPILGYEGKYEVSDHGRIRSLTRWRRGKSGAMVPVLGKVMRTYTKKESARTKPYVEIRLRDGSPRNVPCKSFLVHRLVAQAFIGELFDGAQVDHIDGDHGNNYWKNLRILSAREHGLLHPCIVNKAKNAAMSAAGHAKIAAMRQAGEIVGRKNVKKVVVKTSLVE